MARVRIAVLAGLLLAAAGVLAAQDKPAKATPAPACVCCRGWPDCPTIRSNTMGS